MTQVSADRQQPVLRGWLAAVVGFTLFWIEERLTMQTYSVEYPSQIPAIVKSLRAEGFRAWGEIEHGKEVLCTNADLTEIQIYRGFARARLLHAGLPGLTYETSR